MSRDPTPEELQAMSSWMKAHGYLGYEEFCEALDRGEFRITPHATPCEQLKPADGSEDK